MKKITSKLIIALALSATTLVSCSKENAPLNEPSVCPPVQNKSISIKIDGQLTTLTGGANQKSLSELLNVYKDKDVEELTISGRVLNQKDLNFIKKSFKSVAILDLTEATLAISYNQYGFKDYKNLKKLILPKNLEQIGEGHLGYSNIEEVLFTGNKLKDIGGSAFALNSKIKSLELPASLSTLGREAFAYMEALETIEVPEQVSIIPDECFRLNKALKSVTFKGELFELGNHVFSLCSNLTEIKFTQSTPPKYNKNEWPFVEAEYLTNGDGTARLHFYIPKGSLDAYLKAWNFNEAGDKAYFIEY